MRSRLQFLISRGALVMLACLATYACDVTDDNRLSEPPPVPGGPGKTPSGGAGSTTPAGTIASGTSTVMTAGMVKAAANTGVSSSKASTQDAGMDDADDAGPRTDVGSSLGGRGAAGMLAAGSGGRSGAGGSGGSEGAAGQAGAAGGSSSPECQSQYCFTLIDCWLSGETNCNFTDCVNFTCQ